MKYEKPEVQVLASAAHAIQSILLKISLIYKEVVMRPTITAAYEANE